MTALLNVNNLTIGFGNAPAVVSGVSFQIERGQTLALVGESGSGKTLTCRSILRILPDAARLHSGRIQFTGDVAGRRDTDLLTLNARQMRAIRGNRISMIFQEPMRSLSSLHTIGSQVQEVLTVHGFSRGKAAVRDTLDIFERVGFADPERTFRAYPFELSGGMRQRAMIAMAMIAQPDLLIADEPTTALDVTTQAQVLGLMKDLQRQSGMAILFVTHDLGVVANMAQQAVVMCAGRVMEAGSAEAVLGAPAHGYTQRLLAAAPGISDPDQPERSAQPEPVLQMRKVNKTYSMRGASWKNPTSVHACIDINLDLRRGRTLAIVGESGSGKTTCARIALGAENADAGSQVLFHGARAGMQIDVSAMSRLDKIAFQRSAQMVFQDPFSSLSPRMRIRDALTEPMEIHHIGTRADQRDKAEKMLRWVGLSPDMLGRYPHAFSGGQRQRLSIARALMLDPQILVCDEPTSALDVSVQEQILKLLRDIQQSMGLSYLFISHDLAVVSQIADDVAVMHRGLIVEQGPLGALFRNPLHPYTQALIAAQPVADVHHPIDLRKVALGAGDSSAWPEAFAFLGQSIPALTETDPGHWVRQHV